MAELTVSDLLLRLRDCLCAALENTVDGVPCRCGIVAGASPAWDECNCGNAWVRLKTVSPPPPIKRTNPQCFDGSGTAVAVIATVELSVLRCAAKPDREGEAPTVECVEDRALAVASDMNALYSVRACCVLPAKATWGNYTPLGPAGLCLGGALEVVTPAWLCIDCPSPGESPAESPGESP